VFFVDAWQALRGKLDGDQARVAQSGLPVFEVALVAFLVPQRLAAKVHGTVSQTLADATDLQADLASKIALLQADRTKSEQVLQEIAQRPGGAEWRQEFQALQAQVPQLTAQLRQLADEQQTVTALAQALRDMLTTAEPRRRHV
jgi:hypothetical protein